jgi:excinuclease ABC A subunit
MERANIVIKGARVHNLKDVSLEIPKGKIVIFTGVSGSGKSSLVFDTIYTEAQRQLVETFSSFARARMPKLTRPDMDEIRNISTAIVIDQKKMGANVRSTVGTATEINTYMRLLYSRCGSPFIGPSFFFGFNHPEGMCPDCKGMGRLISIDVDGMILWDRSLREGAIDHPDHKVGGWNWREFMALNLFDVDKKLKDYSKEELDRLLYSDGIPVDKPHGGGTYTKNFQGIVTKLLRLHNGKEEEALNETRKDAYHKYFRAVPCGSCGGSRINERARSVKLNGKGIHELSEMELTDLDAFLYGVEGDVARPLVLKMRRILSHLMDIGVGYLSLSRPVSTLSGGESQRVKMARQLDCDLVDIMYIMDEPTIGLHARDGDRMIQLLRDLRDKGNSVLVVEHDPAVIMAGDHIVDVGPGAGENGGKIVYCGPFWGLAGSGSVTAEYLKVRRPKPMTRKSWTDHIEIKNATLHNLKNVNVRIPKGVLTCITGVAGSGKSSLINEVFLERNKDAIVIDQSPVGRTSRSNPATYIGAFDMIRKEYSASTGADPSLFSFNSRGACPKCKGQGWIGIEMSFLDEVRIECDECQGRRYTEDVLALKHKGKGIDEVLDMTISEAIPFFDNPEVTRRLRVLEEVGLGYLRVGQPLSTLSGGEVQRIKIATELHKRGKVYVMDEPTTGLHMADIGRLMSIIKGLVDRGNTVIVIEHNLDVIKHADWIIDLGPEGGSKGGEVVFEGRPEDIAGCEKSHTGRYLRDLILPSNSNG